ncbi:hypothetical protein OAJ27_02155, partial [bacterium]|nr:hypothetical protein [bacterium]
VVHTGTAHSQSIGINILNDHITEADIDRYASSTPSANILQVDIKASYAYGDNAALKIYMARKKWGTTLNCPD